MERVDKKKIAIALYSNDSYFFALGAFLINIRNYITNVDNIIIYYEGLSVFQKIVY